jgi:hypothetical protein
MADTENPNQPAPAPAPPPAPPAAAPPAAAPAKSDDPASPPWLPERLARAEEQARAKVLSELGVDDPKKAKDAIAAAKKAEDDAKSTAEKLGEATKDAKRAQGEAERLRAITTEYAARMMVGLTDAQRDAVKKIAGEDPGAQLQAITALAPTWAAAIPAPAAAPPVAAPPASTAPPPNAPPPAAPGAPPDHRQVYTALEAKNPFAAAAYGLANPQAYETKT